MAVLVQKFGGTSVATADRILAAARRAIEAKRAGHQVVMVVSARGKKTDELIALAREITDSPPPREMDMLLSTGEQESVALMAMAIRELGEDAVSFTGGQIGILTDSSHTKARIRSIATDRLRAALAEGKIVVAAGFQGVDEDFNITTLGRGGSDTTATALAAALQAEECEIYTDVRGVFTADPRVVKEAKKLDQISYDEMLELASLGAGVMHSRSIEFAKKYRVPLRVRPSFSDEEGTLIVPESGEEERVVTGVAFVRDEVRVSLVDIPDRPGVLSLIFSKMAERKIPIDMVVQDVGEHGLAEVSFTIPEGELAEALTASEEAVRELQTGQVQYGTNVSKVSVVGVGMQRHTGVAAQMFRSLADAGINIEMISTGDIKISTLVSRDQCDAAARAVHAGFELDKALPSPPKVGWRRPKTEPIARPSEELEREVITRLATMEDIVVSEVRLDADQSRVTIRNIPDQVGVAATIFSAIADAGVMVDLIVQNVSRDNRSHMSFTVPRRDLEKCLQAVGRVLQKWPEAELRSEETIGKLSVMGIGLRTHTGVGERLFRALADAGVNVGLVSTSETRFSIIVDAEQAEKAAECLRQTFELNV